MSDFKHQLQVRPWEQTPEETKEIIEGMKSKTLEREIHILSTILGNKIEKCIRHPRNNRISIEAERIQNAIHYMKEKEKERSRMGFTTIEAFQLEVNGNTLFITDERGEEVITIVLMPDAQKALETGVKQSMLNGITPDKRDTIEKLMILLGAI